MSENKKKPISQSSDESQKPRSSSVVEIDVHFDARQLSKTSNRKFLSLCFLNDPTSPASNSFLLRLMNTCEALSVEIILDHRNI